MTPRPIKVKKPALDPERSELSLLHILIERNYERAKRIIESLDMAKKGKPGNKENGIIGAAELGT